MKQGDKVICIDNRNLETNSYYFDKPLIENCIYHIRAIIPGYEYKGQPDGVMLDEIKGSIIKYLCHDGITRIIETHFKKCRFRVIDEIDIDEKGIIKNELISIKKKNNERK